MAESLLKWAAGKYQPFSAGTVLAPGVRMLSRVVWCRHRCVLSSGTEAGTINELNRWLMTVCEGVREQLGAFIVADELPVDAGEYFYEGRSVTVYGR